MMELKDWLIVASTVAGPILAVQAQKFVERFRERRGRKLWVFNTLMATRAARVSVDHVKALNMIDLAFYGSRKFPTLGRNTKDQAVLTAWKVYLDHLNTWKEGDDMPVWTSKSEDLFLDLLTALANALGFSFDRVQLKRGAYFPKGHGDFQLETFLTRKGVLEVLDGKRPLRMEITNLPGPPPAPPPPAPVVIEPIKQPQITDK